MEQETERKAKVINYDKLYKFRPKSKRVQALNEIREHGKEMGWISKMKIPEKTTEEKIKEAKKRKAFLKTIPF